MFHKPNAEPEAENADERGAREIGISAVEPYRAAIQVGRKVISLSSGGPGAKCFTMTLELPRGRLLALAANGPAALMLDGKSLRLYTYDPRSAAWEAGGCAEAKW